MARLENDYDPRGQDRGQAPGEVLPSGYYLSAITGSDIKTTKDGSGNYIELEHTIQSQGYKGRKVWSRINRKNKSEIAERIGREEFARLLDAIGMGEVIIRDTVQLHDKVMCIRVVVEKDQNGGDRNEVKGYFDKSKVGAPAPAPAAAAPAPAWQKPAAAQAQAPRELETVGAETPKPATAAPKKPWEK